MARQYIVKKGDNIWKIAKEYFANPELGKKLADYNGVVNPGTIFIGQVIEIPGKSELVSATSKKEVMGITRPSGLEEIRAIFGDINSYIRSDGTLDPRWEMEHLASAQLPFSIPLSWDYAKLATSIYCHKKIAPIIPEVFAAVDREGLRKEIKTFGGCFNFRSKRTSGKLSTHSWGIAVDINPETNAIGKSGDLNQGVVEIFRSFGFKWGGDWPGKSKDPMHFQFCTGY